MIIILIQILAIHKIIVLTIMIMIIIISIITIIMIIPCQDLAGNRAAADAWSLAVADAGALGSTRARTLSVSKAPQGNERGAMGSKNPPA